MGNTAQYMKLLFVVLCFEWSTQDKVTIQLPVADVKALREHAVTCEKETGVPAAVLKQVIDWPLPNDEPTKKFFYCVCNNVGYADKDGHATVDKLGALKVVNGPQEDFVNKIKECNKIALASSYETLYAVGDCVHAVYAFSVETH